MTARVRICARGHAAARRLHRRRQADQAGLVDDPRCGPRATVLSSACSAWRSPPVRPVSIWSMCGPNFSTFRASRASRMKALVAALAAALVALLGAAPALRPTGPARRPTRRPSSTTPSGRTGDGCPACACTRRGRRGWPPASPGPTADGATRRGPRCWRCRRTPTPPACARSSYATGSSPNSCSPARPAGTSNRGGPVVDDADDGRRRAAIPAARRSRSNGAPAHPRAGGRIGRPHAAQARGHRG